MTHISFFSFFLFLFHNLSVAFLFQDEGCFLAVFVFHPDFAVCFDMLF